MKFENKQNESVAVVWGRSPRERLGVMEEHSILIGIVAA